MTGRDRPPSWRSVAADLDCDLSRAWRLLTDVEQWPRWGPSVRHARLDGPFVTGTTGTVTTAVGITVPVVLRDVVPSDRWSWDVAGLPATSHHVERVDRTTTRVVIGVPPYALPYLAVCTVALRRLRAIA